MVKKRGRKIQFNFSNRFLYTFIAAVIIISLGIVVYAYAGNVGHTSTQIDEIDPTIPKTCTSNQILSWNGTNWKCTNSASGGVPAGYDFVSFGQAGFYLNTTANLSASCTGGPATYYAEARNNNGVLQTRARVTTSSSLSCESIWEDGTTNSCVTQGAINFVATATTTAQGVRIDTAVYGASYPTCENIVYW